MKNLRNAGFAASTLLATLVFPLAKAEAHCDALDGPVVKAAQQALASGDPAPVLVWVQAHDESEIRQEFQRTLVVRTKGKEAQELADKHFFETVVRIHRAGEGAPFTGLKPAGQDLGPAIPAADKALASGSPEALVKLINDEVAKGIKEKFALAKGRQGAPTRDVAAGREYIEAYVQYIHYVERLYADAHKPSEGHYMENMEKHSESEGGAKSH